MRIPIIGARKCAAVTRRHDFSERQFFKSSRRSPGQGTEVYTAPRARSQPILLQIFTFLKNCFECPNCQPPGVLMHLQSSAIQEILLHAVPEQKTQGEARIDRARTAQQLPLPCCKRRWSSSAVLHTANDARKRRQPCPCPGTGSHPSRRGQRRSSPDRDPINHSQEGAVPRPLEGRRRRRRRRLELWRRRLHAQRGPNDWPMPPSPWSQLE